MAKEQETPRYRALEDLRWPEGIVPAGTEFEFDGAPGDTLEPLNKAAENARAAAVAEQKARQAAAPSSLAPGVTAGLGLTADQLKLAIAEAVAAAIVAMKADQQAAPAAEPALS